MVIKEAIEIFREYTSIEMFKKEIELLKSASKNIIYSLSKIRIIIKSFIIINCSNIKKSKTVKTCF